MPEVTFRPEEAAQLQTADEARNYVVAMIEEVAAQIRADPGPPTNEITTLAFFAWKDRLMLTYGRTVGRMEALQVFGVIDGTVYRLLRDQLLATMLHKSTEAALGIIGG